MNLPTLEEYFQDFVERCKQVEDLPSVRQRVLNEECPFLDCGFEKNIEFREMRRFYRQNLEILKSKLITLIDELMKDGGDLKW